MFHLVFLKILPLLMKEPLCCASYLQRLETDLAYWMDHAKANDQGRQHHYDESAAMGPRDSSAFRHGANVNYDYY